VLELRHFEAHRRRPCRQSRCTIVVGHSWNGHRISSHCKATGVRIRAGAEMKI